VYISYWECLIFYVECRVQISEVSISEVLISEVLLYVVVPLQTHSSNKNVFNIPGDAVMLILFLS